MSILSGQSRQEDYRSSDLGDLKQRNNQFLKSTSSSSQKYNEFANSDLGLQRPVDVKDTGFGYHLGFDTKLYYSNNAPSASSGIGRESAGIWENALSNHFLLGAFDLGGAVFSPIISLGYSKFSHFGDNDIDILDFDTLHFSPNMFFQFSNGWTFRAGLGVMLDFSTHDGMEKTYHQISPTIALGKGFSIGSGISTWEWLLAYHITDSDQILDDFLDRFETAFLWSFVIPVNRLEISPYMRLAYAHYSNQSRDDLIGSLGVDLDYFFTEWFSIGLFSNLSFRGSSNDDFDFNRLDIGGGLSLDAKF